MTGVDGLEMHAELDCPRCGRPTDHELQYAGRLLVRARCSTCGAEIARDVRARYLRDLADRIRTKPRRMLRRARRHPLGFAATLPHTTVVKPIQIAREMRLVLRAARPRRPQP